MSTAHDAHAAAAHAAEAHGADAHAFDGEPARALPPDEPRTPNWVPALGLVLFVASGVAFLVWAGTNGTPASAPPAAQAPTAPAQAAPEGRPAPPPPGTAAPTATARQLSPGEADNFRRALEEARKKRAGSPGQPPPAPAPGH